MSVVWIEIGRCPLCGSETEAADGLVHYRCAIAHDPVPYRPVGGYEMDAEEAWRD